jgi:hypothetical protein
MRRHLYLKTIALISCICFALPLAGCWENKSFADDSREMSVAEIEKVLCVKLPKTYQDLQARYREGTTRDNSEAATILIKLSTSLPEFRKSWIDSGLSQDLISGAGSARFAENWNYNLPWWNPDAEKNFFYQSSCKKEVTTEQGELKQWRTVISVAPREKDKVVVYMIVDYTTFLKPQNK